MTKIAINSDHISDPVSAKNFLYIKNLLNGGLGFDNFKTTLVSGVTASIANTEKKFRYTLRPTPLGGLIVVGNAYIHSFTEDLVDIRSNMPDSSFTALLIAGSLE